MEKFIYAIGLICFGMGIAAINLNPKLAVINIVIGSIILALTEE